MCCEEFNVHFAYIKWFIYRLLYLYYIYIFFLIYTYKCNDTESRVHKLVKPEGRYTNSYSLFIMFIISTIHNLIMVLIVYSIFNSNEILINIYVYLYTSIVQLNASKNV